MVLCPRQVELVQASLHLEGDDKRGQLKLEKKERKKEEREERDSSLCVWGAGDSHMEEC